LHRFLPNVFLLISSQKLAPRQRHLQNVAGIQTITTALLTFCLLRSRVIVAAK
jgi:hypothetical protein